MRVFSEPNINNNLDKRTILSNKNSNYKTYQEKRSKEEISILLDLKKNSLIRINKSKS